jgi:hypothetical protein
MTEQKTLDGKTDYKKSKNGGSCIIRYSGNNKMIEEGIENVHKKYPCVKITVNGKKLEEKPKLWDGAE